MAKTKKELVDLQQEFNHVMNKLNDLTEDELGSVSGGRLRRSDNDILKKDSAGIFFTPKPDDKDKDF